MVVIFRREMDKRKREILALVLLTALLIAGLGFFGWYISAGHKWNVAATTIDDVTGSMDGYVVLLYEGTDAPNEQSLASSKNSTADSSSDLLVELRKSYRDKGATVFSLRTETYSYTEPFVLLRNDYRVGFLPVDADTPYLTIDRQIALLQQRGADVVVALEYSENEYLEGAAGVDIIVELGETPLEKDEAAESTEGSSSAGSETGEESDSTSGDDGQSGSSAGSGSSGSDQSSKDETEESNVSGTSSMNSPAETSTKRYRKSDAFIASRCDRGSVSAIFISPNNVVSSKTISE